jgi:alkanesulfonate monooxygenase SsuD/methylene tetrahydromethanopterin reductase-like flavin-dependent oxidoreductase (luciferase family)
VGAGARAEDFAAAEAEFEAPRLRILEQQVATLRRAWAGERVVPGALRPVEPLPIQPGGPEILAGALSPGSIRRARRRPRRLTPVRRARQERGVRRGSSG